jgi:pSer/pThr/pTyr-binding forkhead associated (FHA) protein
MSGSILLTLRILLAIVFYVFLGWALLTLWQDLRNQIGKLKPPKIPTISLKIQTDHIDKVLSFSTSDVIIGRDPASNFYLEDQTISAQHARLSYHHKQWWVEDLNSRNGTYLNQEPVLDAHVITTGDQLRCGGLTIELKFSGENQTI